MSLEAVSVVKKLQEMRDGGYLSDPIMREAVIQIEKSNPKYDWVGVYMYNADEKMLWLHNYVGEPTEHAKIEAGQGVCGTAVTEAKNQVVNDVTTVENYLACSRYVKSEMVVLIRAGDEILGQIDIDSHKKDAFADEDQDAVQRIADKIADVLVAERREA
jgi:L-methionine (R)-S-oxide reductase